MARVKFRGPADEFLLCFDRFWCPGGVLDLSAHASLDRVDHNWPEMSAWTALLIVWILIWILIWIRRRLWRWLRLFSEQLCWRHIHRRDVAVTLFRWQRVHVFEPADVVRR